MIKSILLATAALAMAVPVQAGYVILPHLYAREYCSLRSMGVSSQEATRAAMRESVVSGQSVKVTINGQRVDHDVVKAARAVADRCPQYLQ